MSNAVRQLLLSVPLREVEFEVALGDQVVSLKAVQLTGLEADEVADQSMRDGEMSVAEFYNRRLVASVRDAEGAPVFGLEDLESIRRIPASVLNKLREKVAEANSDITKAEVDAKKKRSKLTDENKQSAQ